MKFRTMALWAGLALAAGLAWAQPAPPVDTSRPAIHVEGVDTPTSPAAQSAIPAPAATPAPQSDAPALPTADRPAEQWLRRIEKAFLETNTVKGKFEQTLINELFSETIEARGDFYFQKERLFRANHELKEEGKWVKDNELLITGDSLWLYSPALQQVEKFRFGASSTDDAGRLHQMFLGFGPKTDEVLKVYEVKVKGEDKGAVTLVFRPLDAAIAADLQFVEITFDAKELLPRRVMWLTPDENRTTIELKNIERNAKMPADIFKPNFPPGTEFFERN